MALTKNVKVRLLSFIFPKLIRFQMASYETYKRSFKQVTLYSSSLACFYRTHFNKFTAMVTVKIECSQALNFEPG